MNLRIGHLSTFYHTSILMMARDTMGAGVEWKLFGTGPAIVHAFERNEIDLAYIGLPPAIIGIAGGVNIKCIAGGHVEGTVICGAGRFRGQPELNDLALILGHFAGHNIGVPGKGSIHDVILTECISMYQPDRDIRIINYKWADQVLEAMHRGEISAAFGTPALAVAVMRYTDGKILCPPSRLYPDNPSYGILVKSELLHTKRDDIEQFLALHEETTSFLRKKPGKAAKIISDYVGIVDESFIMDTLKVSPKYCSALTAGYISSTMGFVKILKRLGYIEHEISSGEIFDTSLIQKIHPGKDHYSDGICP